MEILAMKDIQARENYPFEFASSALM